ncbi:hypothetical protein, partial [Xanthomonas theicola]|uniref:hypothetical protein n=1 Tax=Xanthomonas theicola TaxID=56464 RepID=UPI001B804EA3
MQRMTHRRFTDDFEAQAVALAESIGPQLDMSADTLANWLGASPTELPRRSWTNVKGSHGEVQKGVQVGSRPE